MLKRNATDADRTAVEGYMQAWGFSIESRFAQNTGVRFLGSTTLVEQAFGVQINDYNLSGHTFYANATPVLLPAALAPYVSSVLGLDNANRLRRAASDQTIIGPNGNPTPPYTPGEIASFYHLNALFSAGFKGTGQTIGIVTLERLNLSDVRAFEAAFGLPLSDVTVDVQGSPDFGTTETTLDVSWSSAMAPGARIVVVETTNSAADLANAFNYMATVYHPNVISFSFGTCDAEVAPGTQEALHRLLGGINVPIFVSSGDTGSRECDDNPGLTSASWPATDPLVTAVGGTSVPPN
ncbi:MAG: hypothetical protein KGJ86_11505, partial [Chloroflexota bacterium]|nr:hypothetical protein [Chloroflexota bacterium]